MLLEVPDLEVQVAVRLQAQQEATGMTTAAQVTNRLKLEKWDAYLQALSAGFAGVLDEPKRQVLARRTALIGHALKDMVRKHGSGLAAVLAFPRGGVMNMVFAALTVGDVTTALSLMDLDGLGPTFAVQAEVLAALPADDAQLLAVAAALQPCFESVVRDMHAPGGVFASGLPEETLARGCAQLTVPTSFARECIRIFGLTVVGRRRLDKAEDELTLVGWRNDGRSALTASASARSLRPYSAATVCTYRRVLSKFLLSVGWAAARVPAKGVRGSYTTAVVMRQRIVMRAYSVAYRLSVQQKEFRAMAATQDVMDSLRPLFSLTKALDLVMWTAMVVAYLLGLRLSDICMLQELSVSCGESERRADLSIALAASKADAGGVGYKRVLQHACGCPFEFRSAEGNADGRGYCPNWACGHTPDARWCGACLLLYYVQCLGSCLDGTKASWLFRLPQGTLSWMEGTSRPAVPKAFTEDALPYVMYNTLLKALRLRINEIRERRSLPPYSLAEFHFHMFRHGNVMMSLIFGDSDGEIMRRLRMESSTLLSYRQHVSSAYNILLKQQTLDAHTLEQQVRLPFPSTHPSHLAMAYVLALSYHYDLLPCPLQVLLDADVLAAQMVGRLTGWSVAAVRVELSSFLRYAGCTLKGLRGSQRGFCQVVVSGSAAARRLHPQLSEALLEALGASHDSDGPAAAPALSNLIEAGEAEGLVARPTHLQVAQAIDNDHVADVDVHEDGDTATQYEESEAGTTTIGPSFEDLKEMWREIAEELHSQEGAAIDM